MLVTVHGGITFDKEMKAGRSSWGDWQKWMEDVEWIQGDRDELASEDYWIYGFDTAHYDDNIKNCSKKFVIEETKNFMVELAFYVARSERASKKNTVKVASYDKTLNIREYRK